MMVKAKIILDESKYGIGTHKAWRWSFYLIKDDGTKSLITVTDNEEPILTAVTKIQYKSWANRNIVAIKRSTTPLPLNTIEEYLITIEDLIKESYKIVEQMRKLVEDNS